MSKLHILGVIAALLLIAGCDKKAEAPRSAPTAAPASAGASPSAGVNVSAVTLGNAIGARKKVMQASDNFARNDTIYASVDTTGTGTSTLEAKWTYRANGQDVAVREDTQTVTASGPATSEFHVSNPDGWPAGDYKVEISASGNPSDTRTFTVR